MDRDQAIEKLNERIKEGANKQWCLNTCKVWGITLNTCVVTGNFETFKFLFRYVKHTIKDLNSALCSLCFWDTKPNVDFVKLLLEAGADVNCSNDRPLCWACGNEFDKYKKDALDVVKLLIEAGGCSSVSQKNSSSVSNDHSPSFCAWGNAKQAGQYEIMKLLEEHGMKKPNE